MWADYVYRDILILKRGLEAAGVKFTSAMTAEFDAGGAVTMARTMRIMEEVDDMLGYKQSEVATISVLLLKRAA